MTRGIMAGLVAAALIVACGHPATTTAPSSSGDDTGACKSDDDCVLADQCCDCNNGGGRIAIRKDQADHHKAQLAKECAGMACTAMVSTDGSCNAEATCREGRCAVVPHLGDDTHANPRAPM